MFPIIIDRRRTEEFVACLAEGKAIEPGPEGWSPHAVLALAGACLAACQGQGSRWYQQALRLADEIGIQRPAHAWGPFHDMDIHRVYVAEREAGMPAVLVNGPGGIQLLSVAMAERFLADLYAAVDLQRDAARAAQKGDTLHDRVVLLLERETDGTYRATPIKGFAPDGSDQLAGDCSDFLPPREPLDLPAE